MTRRNKTPPTHTTTHGPGAGERPRGPDPDVSLVRQLFLDGMPLHEIAEKFERDGHEIGELIRQGQVGVLRCSFCGRSHTEVRMMISGAFAFICEHCLDMCLQIVQRDMPQLLMVGIDHDDPPPDVDTGTSPSGSGAKNPA